MYVTAWVATFGHTAHHYAGAKASEVVSPALLGRLSDQCVWCNAGYKGVLDDSGSWVTSEFARTPHLLILKRIRITGYDYGG